MGEYDKSSKCRFLKRNAMGVWDVVKCVTICSLGFLCWATGQAGFAIALVGMCASLLGVMGAKNRTTALTNVTAIWLTGVLFCGLLSPAIRWGRESARRSQCRNNLKQIGLALRNYHDRYGASPPAIAEHERGNLVHSWRVLLLPFLDEERLFKQYDFSEPWDGPHNRALAKQSPQIYRCPSDSTNPGDMANYAAIVRPTSLRTGTQTNHSDELHDGDQKKVFVVEIADSGIHWMEPRDLSWSEAMAGINSKTPPAISSHHDTPKGILHRERGAHLLFPDSSVLFLSQYLNKPALEVLLTQSSGGAIAAETTHVVSVDPARVVTLSVFVAITVVFVVGMVVLLRARKASQASR